MVHFFCSSHFIDGEAVIAGGIFYLRPRQPLRLGLHSLNVLQAAALVVPLFVSRCPRVTRPGNKLKSLQ